MRLFTCAAATLLLPAASFAQTGRVRAVNFATEVHPVLESRCRSCHIGDAAQAGLRLGSRDDLIRGGKSGPAIVPGKASESLLIQRVTGQRGLRMPPSGPPLSDDVVAALRQWIDQGAVWDAQAKGSDRLAPLAPRNPDLPAGAADHPLDRLAPLRSRPVSDAVFARRAYLDLHGLPPTPEQLQAFVSGRSATKRAELIDRLLAERDPYAEHWISFWNDLLRNDEGVVYHGERKSITNWLLAALKTNMPYDRMVQALLNPTAKDDPDGFLIGVNWRGVVSASQTPPMQAAQNSAQVFLGMNLKCAACHDSFVNRWKLRDTFGLAAMFADQKLELVRCDVPTGRTAEARFPLDDLKVAFDDTLAGRRAAAANWFTARENGRFARTVVNRYWRVLFGRGLVEPVDDMDAEPWSQDVLDWLAWDFAEHGYDLQHLLRRVMTSQAYQAPAVLEDESPAKYVFRGPLPRRLTAEQFQDAISSVSGDWRIRVPRNDTAAVYTREWRLKSDPLSRALGRPIRDQVYTERSTQATTLQALELTNGPLLSERLERAAKALLGELKPPPANRFDSKMMRSGAAPVEVDITGAKELWLVVEDVDSYDPSRVETGWADAELVDAGGVAAPFPAPAREFTVGGAPMQAIPAKLPSMVRYSLDRPFTHFRAKAVIDDRSKPSDIAPAVRFFAFTEKPDRGRLVRVDGQPLVVPPSGLSGDALIERLYLHLFSRPPSAGERAMAKRMLGETASAEGVEDLLWALLMSPEFQFIR